MGGQERPGAEPMSLRPTGWNGSRIKGRSGWGKEIVTWVEEQRRL
jgi:hypothetical protein